MQYSRVHFNPESRHSQQRPGMSAMGQKRRWSLSSLLQIQPAHCTPFLPAQTSNGTSSLDPAGNANTFCISFSLQKIVSYQSCLGCWSPQLL